MKFFVVNPRFEIEEGGRLSMNADKAEAQEYTNKYVSATTVQANSRECICHKNSSLECMREVIPNATVVGVFMNTGAQIKMIEEFTHRFSLGKIVKTYD